MKLFAILDVKSNTFSKPFAELNVASALRSFEMGASDERSTLAKFPDDFCLCELATFDEFNGSIVPHVSPMNLGSARSVIRSEPKGTPLAEVRQ